MREELHPCDPLPAIELELARRIARAGPSVGRLLLSERDQAIESSLASGASSFDVAAAHGLTVGRINQIRLTTEIRDHVCNCAPCRGLRRLHGRAAT